MATFWLPLWSQVAIFIISLFLLNNQFLLIIPAIFADALYSPNLYSINGFKYTLFAILFIFVYRFILERLRV